MVSHLKALRTYVHTPELVKAYSSTDNSIHYDMASPNSACIRATLIGGGIGVHLLIHTLWREHLADAFDMPIYFRRPIFRVDARG